MDETFARSRRRAAARRASRRPRAWMAGPGARLAVAGTVVLATAGGLAAKDEAPRAAASNAPAVSRSAPPSRCPVPDRFRPAFVHAARESRLPLPLIVAVAQEESRMTPNARSHRGAIGLLQVMPSTARDVGLDAHDPRQNVRAGARYLARLLARFDDLDIALAAYNAGPAAVERAAGPPTLATVAYVENVKSRATALGDCV